VVRLRTLLLLGLLAWGLSSVYPRLQAAFRLHDATVAIADYALCMVGPTGPASIRDRPSDFERLVRRRLVAAGPGERPFAKCGKAAAKVTGKVEVERNHALPAGDFREHGHGTRPLSELGVSVAPLADLAELAWPFARGGYTKLIKPSLGALEAPHQPAPARPGLGKGLPARGDLYRSVWKEGSGFAVAMGFGSELSLHATSDRGISFKSLGRREALIEAHAERCASPDGAQIYRLAPREDGAAQLVFFSSGETASSTAEERQGSTSSELSPMAERVLAVACDERSLVSLSVDRERFRLRGCPFGGRCAELPVPALVLEAGPGTAVDLAKLKGVIVVSVAAPAIVRVVSSRDEGRTFTPPIVAFNAAEYPDLVEGRRTPTRLLALGERLLLYAGAAKSTEAYPLLASDDQGVSFRTP